MPKRKAKVIAPEAHRLGEIIEVERVAGSYRDNDSYLYAPSCLEFIDEEPEVKEEAPVTREAILRDKERL